MGMPFTPLPPEVFPEEARPHIARLNKFLTDLSRLEGVLRSPTTDSAKSDVTVRRAVDPAVAISRVTPTPGSAASGASVTIGTPALSLSTSNVAGTTTSVISTNSQIAVFGTGLPAGISSGYAVGASAYAARADHIHGLPDDIAVQRLRVDSGGIVGSTRPEINFIAGASVAITVADDPGNNRANVTIGVSGSIQGSTPALVLSTSNNPGAAATFLRTNDQIAIFGTQVAKALSIDSLSTTGTSAFSARADHAHSLSVVGSANPATFAGAASAGTGPWASAEDHVHKSQTSADWYASGTTRGMITKDVQATPRYWRIRVQGDTSVVTGGCTLSISSGGAITATRDAGSSGTIVIRLDDTGTTAP